MSQTKAKKSKSGAKSVEGTPDGATPARKDTQAPKSFEQLKENIEANLKKKSTKKPKPERKGEDSTRGKKRNAQGDVLPPKASAGTKADGGADDEFQAEGIGRHPSHDRATIGTT